MLHPEGEIPAVLLFGAGMGFFVDFLHALGADVGVNLGGAQVFMPEHLLDAAQVGSGIQQVGREGVAQLVRRQVGGRLAAIR